ncbi:MAG: hypothetical protein CR986_07940 [Ignavibacteriae bacterium]|nr:MAG: hypothetical protein CR986_07940 [Ignavibacteriota bacterium]
MNTSQMMITLGAMVLLALVILRVNNGFMNTNSTLINSKLGVVATSLASSFIEEASGKIFDQKTDSHSASDVSELTASSHLGPESGEVYPYFNDFDDFNKLHRVDNSSPAGQFVVDCMVNYVKDTNLDGSTNAKTWHKKITVFVSSPSMYGLDGIPDTIKMSAVNSYWFSR